GVGRISCCPRLQTKSETETTAGRTFEGRQNARAGRLTSHITSEVPVPCSVENTLVHLVLNFRDPAPPSPRGVLAYATPRRFPFRLKRLAVTEEQIDEWHLPTRPTKRGDSRARSFAA